MAAAADGGDGDAPAFLEFGSGLARMRIARPENMAPPGHHYVCEHTGCNYSDDVFDRVAQCGPHRPLQEPRAPVPA
jgi:hypothetical protein